jgi:hypothetical protein
VGSNDGFPARGSVTGTTVFGLCGHGACPASPPGSAGVKFRLTHPTRRELQMRLQRSSRWQWYSFERDQGSMRYAPQFSVFSRRLAFAGIAVLGLLATPSRSPAQDAGVSGIPPGPGNVNGLNGSVRDPSGIGNAARMPALPSPSVAPVVPPTASPSATYRAMPVQRSARVTRTRRTRFAKSRYGHAAEKAAVRENDRLLDRKLTSICRGC